MPRMKEPLLWIAGFFIMDKRLKHGLYGHRLYDIWADIKRRCYNNKNKRYEYYGARGIKICDEWQNDVKAFYDYVIALPNYDEKRYSIDRINNDGNYEPGNVRWASDHTQKANRRKSKKNKTGYSGVYINKHGRYIAMIGFNKKKIYVGIFGTAKEAAIARNNYIIKNELLEYNLALV